MCFRPHVFALGVLSCFGLLGCDGGENSSGTEGAIESTTSGGGTEASGGGSTHESPGESTDDPQPQTSGEPGTTSGPFGTTSEGSDDGSGGGSTDTGDDLCGPPVDFATQVVPILAAQCTGGMCHDAVMPRASLDLLTEPHAAMVNVPSVQCDARLLVDPGSPQTSYLVDKLRGRALCDGDLMPKDEPPLSPKGIATIEAWICQGAPG